ncbi:MAG: MG2 domain-containing protein, partial [Lachnospiraceae bacterium]|nr:MG2 domain-containing protein [Lachnospiraceae bacterium]
MKKIFEAIGCVFLGLILRMAVCAIVVLISMGIALGMRHYEAKKQQESKTQIVKEAKETTEAVEDDYEENVLKPVPTVREAKEVKDPMEVLEVAGYRDTDKSMYIEIKFSKEIADKFDASSYVKIDPDISYTVSKVDKRLIVKGGFDATKKYKVSVLSGIKSVEGTATSEEKVEEVVFAQKQPKLMFTNDGIILPSVNEKKIYVRSLNVNKINVRVKKVYANNTTQFLQHFDFTGNGNYYSYDFDNVGDELYDVKFDIENEMDTWVQTAIDLNGVLDGNGIYMIDVSFDKNGTSYKFPSDTYEWVINDYIYQNGRISKTLLLTDVGIMATVHDDGIRANILDILNNNLIKGARVYLMSRNNQILEEKSSDADGTVEFSNHKNSFYIMVEHRNSRSILLLKNALNTNGFSVDGVYATNGIRGYIYTERGVYRPGETIYVSIIARNNGEPLEAKQPVKITVYDPTGVKMIENDVINNGKNGFYTYTFKTDISSRTGIWRLEATIGDEVIEKDISVETVAPNKIKVNLHTPDAVNYNDDMSGWSISSNYLFGSPASDMKYRVHFDITEEPIDFPEYNEYTFKAPSSYRGYYTSRHYEGVLDKNGEATFVPNFKDVEFGSINMLADVSGRVTDDGGHNVTTKKYVKIKKYDTYIGIEDTNTYRKPGDKLNLKVICVTEDEGKMVAGKTLKCRLYGNDYNWWWDYADYDKFIRSFKSDKHTTLMGEYEFTTQDVPTLLEYELPNAEYIYVEIVDESTGQITGVNLQAS